MRGLRPIALFLALSAVAGCNGSRAPAERPRTVASARRGGPAGSRERREGHAPPAVDSLAQCPQETFRTLARMRAGRTLHGTPLCSTIYNGRYAVVVATGTEQEASDVWAVFHDGRRDEVHRVGNWPAGARIEFGRIAQGWVYLLGRGIATDDMPAGARLLAIFPLPSPAGTAPELGALSPLESGLLRATDLEDLERRLGFDVPTRDPTPSAATRVVQEIARGGPNSLFEHLTPEGSPTLRQWQTGMFQEADYASPQGDPTSPHVARALQLLREIAPAMDCTAGDRCVGRPERPPPPGQSPPQVLLRYDGTRVVVAAFLSAVTPRVRPATDRSAVEPWGRELSNRPEDLATAERLSLDGQVRPPVVASERSGQRAIAFNVALASGGIESRLYVITQGRAPRGFIDPSAGRGPVERELHLRDYDRDGGLELLSLAQRGDDVLTSIASVAVPPSAGQRVLVHRLDMLRGAFGDSTLAGLDQHLRAFESLAADAESGCALLDRLHDADPRALAAAVPALLVIDYAERGQPLRGQTRRLQRRDIQRMGTTREALGPFAGSRCSDLRCVWDQGLCLPGNSTDEGVLWFADGGRRIAAVSRYTGR